MIWAGINEPVYKPILMNRVSEPDPGVLVESVSGFQNMVGSGSGLNIKV